MLFTLLAQTTDTANTVFPIENYEASIVKMFGLLLLLIAFLILTAWLLKRFLRFRMQASSIGQSIKILEKRILSPKSILYLVEVDDQKFLISESQVQIQKIDSVKEKID